MAPLTTYGLDEFIAELQELVRSQADQKTRFDRGSACLARLIRNPRAIPEEFCHPSGRGRRPNHGSWALHRSAGLFVSSVVWGPGDGIEPHDHQTWGMIGVFRNAIQETRYRRTDRRDREGYAVLEKDRVMLLKPGEISLLVPGEDEIHRMDNFSDRPTVEVHVYGKDLVGLPRHMYDLANSTMKGFSSDKFDNC